MVKSSTWLAAVTAANRSNPIPCLEDPHEIERLKAAVREQSLREYATIKRTQDMTPECERTVYRMGVR